MILTEEFTFGQSPWYARWLGCQLQVQPQITPINTN